MLDWMFWTLPTAIFFIVIGCILVVMTVYEVVSPCTERKGFLPISTTRGDRLFIGLVAAAYINMLVLGLTDWTLWIGLAISVVLLAVLLRWG